MLGVGPVRAAPDSFSALPRCFDPAASQESARAREQERERERDRDRDREPECLSARVPECLSD